MSEALRRKLLAMMEKDRLTREALAETGELFQGYASEMVRVHAENAQALEEIVAEHGWPGKSLVGEEGAHAAWLILQHAIGSPSLQRRCLPLLKEAAARGELRPSAAAYLEDRICFFERRPQKYGTQFDWDENGRMSPWELQDPARVNEYRESVGLPPLEETVERTRRRSAMEPPPADLEERRREFLAWAKEVGWLACGGEGCR